jgi:ketosteroid isomerase-like protein
MAETDNKQLATDFVGSLEANGVRGSRQYLTDDFKWWLPRLGNVDQRMEELFEATKPHLKRPSQLTVEGVTAEGNRVAVEVGVDGELVNGRRYLNKVHFLFLFRDSKIYYVKEYNDSKHSSDTWGDIL